MKPKIAFIFDHKYPQLWKDGLYAALQTLHNDFDILMFNLQYPDAKFTSEIETSDFVLGWGAFNSPVDRFLQTMPAHVKRGLCVAGNTYPPQGHEEYRVLFYETEWSKRWLMGQGVPEQKLIHAFGANTDIYHKNEFLLFKVWNYLTVGAFSYWKRQRMILQFDGDLMAIGEIQKDNFDESFEIIQDLLKGGCAVSDMVSPEKLAFFYNASQTVYIPALLEGGGERAVLEARACDANVVVETDNPKLVELVYSDVWDHRYYAKKLKEGISAAL